MMTIANENQLNLSFRFEMAILSGILAQKNFENNELTFHKNTIGANIIAKLSFG